MKRIKTKTIIYGISVFIIIMIIVVVTIMFTSLPDFKLNHNNHSYETIFPNEQAKSNIRKVLRGTDLFDRFVQSVRNGQISTITLGSNIVYKIDSPNDDYDFALLRSGNDTVHIWLCTDAPQLYTTKYMFLDIPEDVSLVEEHLGLLIVERHLRPLIKDEDYIQVTIIDRLTENMPPFKFEIIGYINGIENYCSVENIIIKEVDSESTIQELFIPDLSIFGRTYTSDRDTLGFELIDLNFDGYKDIRQFDTDNHNMIFDWIFFVWNPSIKTFVVDKNLMKLSQPYFDQINKEIRTEFRETSSSHTNSVYKYIDQQLIKVKHIESEWLSRKQEDIDRYLKKAGIDSKDSINIKHMQVYEPTDAFDEFTKTEDSYIIYIENSDEILATFDATSELGIMIKDDD